MFVTGWQFWIIGDEETSLTDLDFSEDRLMHTSPDLVAVMSACDYYHTGVTVELLDAVPPIVEGWDRVEETDASFTQPAHLLQADGQLPKDNQISAVSCPAGRYRIRAHVRGQEAQRAVNLLYPPAPMPTDGQPREQFLIQLWPISV